MVNYPTSLDALSNPASSTDLADPALKHSLQHASLNDIVEALEAKLGIGASTPGAAAGVLRRLATGSSGWGQIQAGDYGAGSIGNADLAALTIRGGVDGVNSRIAPGTINSQDIQDNSILTSDIAADNIINVTAWGVSPTSTGVAAFGGMAGSFGTVGTTTSRVLYLFNLIALTAGGASAFVNLGLYINGSNYANWVYDIRAPSEGSWSPIGFLYSASLGPGSYSVGFGWSTSAGTLSHSGGTIAAFELKR